MDVVYNNYIHFFEVTEMKTYLFDFDGTLVDSMPVYAGVMKRILDENNIENFLEDIEYENIESVKDILIDVKQNGDSAVRKYSYEFDKMEFDENSTFEISEEEIKNALNSIDEKTLDAIKKAIKNIQKFAKTQLKSIKELKIKEKGSIVGHKITPIESVLCYAPGGGYPLPSSAIMTVAVAKVAGVKNIYLTSPKIHSATIVAGHLAGTNKIFKSILIFSVKNIASENRFPETGGQILLPLPHVRFLQGWSVHDESECRIRSACHLSGK